MTAHVRGRRNRQRPRWRAELVLVVALVIALVIGGAAAILYKDAHRSDSAVGKAPPLAVPRCTSPAGEAPALGASGGSVRLAHPLTAIAVSANGRYTFAAMGHHIDVLRNFGGTPSRHPVQVIRLAGAARGEMLTANGHYLLVAAGDGAAVISVRAAEDPGFGTPVLGQLARPGSTAKVDATALAVSASTGDYVFVTLASDNLVAVFSLAKGLAGHFGRSDYIGAVPSTDPVAIAGSPDGDWLYVTSKSAGTVSVLSEHAAETSPETAVIATAKAGCSPSQVLTSADGGVVWITARDSDALIGYSAAKLRAGSKHALVAVVPVGEGPVDEALVNGGQDIVTLDVGRFVPGGGNLAIVSTGRALAGGQALLRLVKTTLLPRQASVEQTQSAIYLLLTFYQSRELQVIRVAGLF